MDKNLPCKSQSEIKKYQSERLIDQLTFVSQHSPFYKEYFAQHNVDVSKLTSVDDLVSLPITTKEHLQKRNMDFLCVDRDDIIDYITTSGTTC